MPRTVVPPRPAIGATDRVAEGFGPEFGTTAAAQPATAGDSLPEKFVKYVPAETIAFFVPTSAALGVGEQGWVIALILIALVGNPLYLYQVAPSGSGMSSAAPLLHFYLLADLAFLSWALGTSQQADAVFGISATEGGILLAVGVFLIPLVDGILNEVSARRSVK